MLSRHVLGIDPGSAKLGLSYVVWNGDDCNDEKNFSVEWMCLIHLTGSFKGAKGARDDIDASEDEENKITGTEIVKYKEMHDQIERLQSFLENNKSFNAILNIKGLRVCIEQQEGARDINVLFRLMRINFLSGVICGYLKRKKVPFTFVPKTYKCGWSFMSTVAKKRLEGITKKKKVSAERKKNLTKQYRKEATCSFVRRTIDTGNSSEKIKLFSARSKDSDFNHVADSASQAIRYIKELKLSGCFDNQLKRHKTKTVNDVTKATSAPLKKVKDNISKAMKDHLLTSF